MRLLTSFLRSSFCGRIVSQTPPGSDSTRRSVTAVSAPRLVFAKERQSRFHLPEQAGKYPRLGLPSRPVPALDQRLSRFGALLGRSGTTDVEVTTGNLRRRPLPQGRSSVRSQVEKAMTPNGVQLFTSRQERPSPVARPAFHIPNPDARRPGGK